MRALRQLTPVLLLLFAVGATGITQLASQGRLARSSVLPASIFDSGSDEEKEQAEEATSLKSAMHVATGLLEGLVSNATLVKTCLADLKKFPGDIKGFETAIGKTMGGNMIEGVGLLLDATKSIVEGVKSCTVLTKDSASVLRLFKDRPATDGLLATVSTNAPSFFGGLSHAFREIRSKKFESGGVQLGVVVRGLLVDRKRDTIDEDETGGKMEEKSASEESEGKTEEKNASEESEGKMVEKKASEDVDEPVNPEADQAATAGDETRSKDAARGVATHEAEDEVVKKEKS